MFEISKKLLEEMETYVINDHKPDSNGIIISFKSQFAIDLRQILEFILICAIFFLANLFFSSKLIEGDLSFLINIFFYACYLVPLFLIGISGKPPWINIDRNLTNAHIEFVSNLISKYDIKSEGALVILRRNMDFHKKGVQKKIRVLYLYMFSMLIVISHFSINHLANSDISLLKYGIPLGALIIVFILYIAIGGYAKKCNLVFDAIELGANEFSHDLLQQSLTKMDQG